MAIDEKKAILRGLSATAQQMRAEAASPEAVARVESARRKSDRQYRMLSGPILLLPVGMALLAAGWEEFRFYTFGTQWGSDMSFFRYRDEGILVVCTGLVLCGVGFGLWWLFKGVCGTKMRLAGLVGNIAAPMIAITSLFFLNFSYTRGREAAYGRLNYAVLVAAAPEIEKIRTAEGLAPGSPMDDSAAYWSKVPQAVRELGAERIYFMDHGFALELDDSGTGGSKEGLLVPQSMSEGVADTVAKKYGMDIVSETPVVLRFREVDGDGVWLNGVLDETATPPG